MARIGCLCLPAFGHFNPLATLAWTLQQRGHVIGFAHVRDFQSRIEALGFRYHPFGDASFPAGSVEAHHRHVGRARGFAALAITHRFSMRYAETLLHELPALLEREEFDLLVVDQADMSVNAIARLSGIPYISVALCLPMNRERDLPLWSRIPFDVDSAQSLESRQLCGIEAHFRRPMLKRINAHLTAHGAAPVADLEDLWSDLLQLTQLPAAFDFPRTTLPPCFRYTGPFHAPTTRAPVAFPYDQLDGRPLVYVSFGSMVNQQHELFRVIAEACVRVNAQLVLSLGGGGIPEDLPALAGRPVVVGFAPQLEILRRARVMVTHAGLNSTLECLAAGVPMLAIPLTNDEPAVAARIARSGTGLCLNCTDATLDTVTHSLERLLADRAFHDAAQAMRADIEQTNGLQLAVDLIERAGASAAGRIPAPPSLLPHPSPSTPQGV